MLPKGHTTAELPVLDLTRNGIRNGEWGDDQKTTAGRGCAWRARWSGAGRRGRPARQGPGHGAGRRRYWTGFYAGANVGYSWGHWDSSSLSPIFPTGSGVTSTTIGGLAGAILTDFGSTASPNVKGWVGGGQLGYNWLNGSWLYGLEADIQATGQRASLNGGATVFRAPLGDGIATITQNETNSWKLPWFATFRGRLGWTYDQSWLFYATGGLAVGHEKFSNTTSLTAATTVPAASLTTTVSSSEGTTRVGFAAGAGVAE